MSKNTASNAFRKIDVDQFNEDNFKDDELPADSGSGRGVSQQEVQNLLSSNKHSQALKLVLQTSPAVISTNNPAKDPTLALMIKVLTSIKASQVDGIVKELDNDQRDVLMRYIYRGFEIPAEGSSGHLLIWHEKVFEISGVGSIVRVLTDRKRVRA